MTRMFQLGCLLLLASAFLIGCAATNRTWIPLNTDKIKTNQKAKTLASPYERSYGQERFMSTTAMIAGALGVIADQSLRQTSYQYHQYNTNNSAQSLALAASIQAEYNRKNSSEFEAKMGDCDLFGHFVDSFNASRDSIKYFDLQLTFDSTEHSKIIQRLVTYDNNELDPSYTGYLNQSGVKYISAFKFQYGIGARAGGEQFALTKKYRPFVRVVGLVKDVKTNDFVWGNKITLFSETMYHGVNEAKNAPKEELVQELKILTDELVEIIIADLNGQRYDSEGLLVDYNPNYDDIL